MKNHKISIIGAGNVGGLTAMRIAEAALGDVILVDIAKNLAQAKTEDIKDAISIFNKGASIQGTDDISKIKESNIVVITAGVARRPGMSRDDLLKINTKIVSEVSKGIKRYAPKAIVVVVSNPVDVMTYLVLKKTGFNKRRVFGMGSSLDSGRFATLITKKLNLRPGSIKAKVIGSHSNSMLPIVNSVKIKNRALINCASDKNINDVVEGTKNRGAEIVGLFGSGSAYFAPSAAIFNIVRAIIEDKDVTIPVSCLLNGEYGVGDVCIGVPAKIYKGGIKKIIKLRLTEQEQAMFLSSVDKVKQSIVFLNN